MKGREHPAVVKALEAVMENLKEAEREYYAVLGLYEKKKEELEGIVKGLLNCHLKWIKGIPYVYESHRNSDGGVETIYLGPLYPTERATKAPPQHIASLVLEKPGIRKKVKELRDEIQKLYEEKKEMEAVVTALRKAKEVLSTV